MYIHTLPQVIRGVKVLQVIGLILRVLFVIYKNILVKTRKVL